MHLFFHTVNFWLSYYLEKLIGKGSLKIPFDQEEMVVDQWIDLDHEGQRSNLKEHDAKKEGRVHIRLCVSVHKETPSPIPALENNVVVYNQLKQNMKTGDLILYNGVGSIDSATKLLSGSNYSRAGLILKIPDRYTRRIKLHVLEITRNIGKFVDAYTFLRTPGVKIFKLKERIHFVNCRSIWWVPLKEPLNPTAGEQNMIEWVQGVSSKRLTLENLPAVPKSLEQLFGEYQVSIHKNPYATEEIHSAHIIMNALRLGGKRLPIEVGYVSPAKLLDYDIYEMPVSIRDLKPQNTSHSLKNTNMPSMTQFETKSVDIKEQAPPPLKPKPSTTLRASLQVKKPPSQNERALTNRPKSSYNLTRVNSEITTSNARNPNFQSYRPIIPVNASTSNPPPQHGSFGGDGKPNLPPRLSQPPLPKKPSTNNMNSLATENPLPKPVLSNKPKIPPPTLKSSNKTPPPRPESPSIMPKLPPPLKKKPQNLKVSLPSAPKKHLRTVSGNLKSGPSDPITSNEALDENTKGIVSWDFVAETEKELDCKEGDILTLLDASDPDWYVASLNDKIGCIPKSFVNIC